MNDIDLSRAAILPDGAAGTTYELVVAVAPRDGVANVNLKPGARLHSVIPLGPRSAMLGAPVEVLLVIDKGPAAG